MRPRFDPWVGKIHWEGHGNPLQYSCLENSKNRGAWWATVHGVTESDTTEELIHTYWVDPKKEMWDTALKDRGIDLVSHWILTGTSWDKRQMSIPSFSVSNSKSGPLIQTPIIFNLQLWCFYSHLGFSGGSGGKESACNAGDQGSIPWSERSLGEGKGNPFQYSCLENSKNRGTWQATVRGVLEMDTTELLTQRWET